MLKTGAARMSDVARLAGVSTMTVSRALRGSSVVSDDLRQRVLAAVTKLKYHPNEIARSLREQKSRQIGIIVPYLFDPFFAVCAHAVSEVAKRHQHSVILSTSNEDWRAEFEEACQMVRRNVGGLIIIPAAGRQLAVDPALSGPELEGVPMAMIDRPVEPGAFDCVLVENLNGTRRGTEHLLSLGHRRIAFVGFKQELYTLEMRYQGYTAAMEGAGLTPVRALLSGVLDDSLGTLRKLLSKRQPPTALFCGNNLITRHVLHALKAMGHVPPDPVALVSFDDFEMADLMRPGITAVRQPVEEMSRLAAEMLFERMAGERKAPARCVTLPVDLVVRGSCGSPQN